MTGMILILLLALLFVGIASWAGANMLTPGDKSAPRGRAMPRAPQAPADPWGAGNMRRRERDSLRPGERLR